MKKLLFVMIMSLLVITLGACNKGNSIVDNPKNCVPSNDPDNPNFCGEEIIILHGAVSEVDPFNEQYSGLYQQEKQDLQRAVEEKYNVQITYKKYPDNAAWGPERVKALINASTAQEPIGHIYAISSNWIADLASAKAIVPITDFDKDYGSEHFTDSMKTYSRYKDDLYGFETGKIYNDVGLMYNQDLLDYYGIEDPAKLWNEGKWTWEKFRSTLLDLKEVLPEDYYPMSGDPGLLAIQMIASNGGTILDPDFYQVTVAGTPAVQALNFLNGLYTTTGVWDPNYGGDSSPAFVGGKVGMHLGELWFVNADNRFGQRDFVLSYVPLPIGKNVDEDLSNYRMASTSASVWALSSGYEEPAKTGGITDEFIYRIWTEMQYWIPEEELDSELEMNIAAKFNNTESVEAYLDVKNRNYYEQILDFVNGYNSGLYDGLKSAIKEGDALSKMESLKESIQTQVNDKLNR